MKRMKTKITAIAVMLFCLSLGTVVGYSIIPKLRSSHIKTNIEELPRTLEFVTTHTQCGHVSTFTEPALQLFSSREEIQHIFPSWTIRTITDEKIVLDRKAADYCPEHYLVYLKNNRIYIETLSGNAVTDFSAHALSISTEETQKLTKGIYLNGKHALTAFMEDFNS